MTEPNSVEEQDAAHRANQVELDEHNSDVPLLHYMIDTLKHDVARYKAAAEGRPLLEVKLGPEGQLPTRSHDGDAGFDLYCSDRVIIAPNTFVDIPCDIEIALPANMWGLVIGRSSALRSLGLMVTQGVIDAGYRGPIFAGVWNLVDHPVQVERGERVAQLIPLPLTAATVQAVAVPFLPPGDRGANGFGSTGT